MSLSRLITQSWLKFIRQPPIFSRQLSAPLFIARHSFGQPSSLLSPLAAVATASVRHFRLTRDSEARYDLRPPVNWGIQIVHDKEAFVIERSGKYVETLTPGIHFLVPFVDKIAYVHSLKQQPIHIPTQFPFTQDGVGIAVYGILYIKIVDPLLASYEVKHPINELTKVAQVAMHDQLSQMTLDRFSAEQDFFCENILCSISDVARSWGIECVHYMLYRPSPPNRVRIAMEILAKVLFKKLTNILDPKGKMRTLISRAYGVKGSVIVAAEADMMLFDLAAKSEKTGATLAEVVTEEKMMQK